MASFLPIFVFRRLQLQDALRQFFLEEISIPVSTSINWKYFLKILYWVGILHSTEQNGAYKNKDD